MSMPTVFVSHGSPMLILEDRPARAFGLLLVLVVLTLFAAPLYAGHVAATTPEENHLTDQVTIDGERKVAQGHDRCLAAAGEEVAAQALEGLGPHRGVTRS